MSDLIYFSDKMLDNVEFLLRNTNYFLAVILTDVLYTNFDIVSVCPYNSINTSENNIVKSMFVFYFSCSFRNKTC